MARRSDLELEIQQRMIQMIAQVVLFNHAANCQPRAGRQRLPVPDLAADARPDDARSARRGHAAHLGHSHRRDRSAGEGEPGTP